LANARLGLQLQAFAAGEIARGFLGHFCQLHFYNFGNINEIALFKIFCSKCVLHFRGLFLAI